MTAILKKEQKSDDRMILCFQSPIVVQELYNF